MAKTLEQQLQAFAMAVANDIKSLKLGNGSLTLLETDEKTNLVGAINEVLSKVSQVTGQTSGVTTQEVSQMISTEIMKLVNSAPTTADTLKELADLIESNKSGLSAFTQSLNNRVRFDDAQVLTESQQIQVCQNIGIGSPTTDLLAVYNTAKA